MKKALIINTKKTFAALAIHNYRLFAIGNLISQFGGWIQAVALGWVSLQITHSGTQLGLVQAMVFVPVLVAGPWGGIVADRFPKRNVMLYTQTALGLVAFAASVLIWTNTLTLWSLYAIALLTGISRVFDDPARHTLASELVEKSHLKNAVSLNAVTYNIARVIGPALAGVLIAVSGTAVCFFINAVSFVVSVYTLVLMRRDELRFAPKSTGSSSVWEGVQYVLATPVLRNMLLAAALTGTFAYEFQVTFPLLATYILHGDAAMLGYLWSTFGVGALIGAFYSAQRHHTSERQFAVLLFCFGVAFLLSGFVSSFYLLAFSIALMGFFGSNVMAVLISTLQLEAIPEMRGRVMALRGVAIVGSTAIGAPIIGFVSEHAGVRYGLVLGGISALLSVAIIYMGRSK